MEQIFFYFYELLIKISNKLKLKKNPYMKTNFQLKHGVVFSQQEYFGPFELTLYLVARNLGIYKV